MRDEGIDYLLGPVPLKAEMSFLSVRRFYAISSSACVH